MVTRYSLSRLSITCTKVPSYQINNRIFVRIPAIYDIHFRPNYFKCNFDLCYFFGGGGGDGGAWHASGCKKGAAEEPLRGRLNYKP